MKNDFNKPDDEAGESELLRKQQKLLELGIGPNELLNILHDTEVSNTESIQQPLPTEKNDGDEEPSMARELAESASERLGTDPAILQAELEKRGV